MLLINKELTLNNLPRVLEACVYAANDSPYLNLHHNAIL